jgi:hypothetical protein
MGMTQGDGSNAILQRNPEGEEVRDSTEWGPYLRRSGKRIVQAPLRGLG